jgi:hypothetical protein
VTATLIHTHAVSDERLHRLDHSIRLARQELHRLQYEAEALQREIDRKLALRAELTDDEL